MSDRTFARKKATASNYSQPSLVSPTTPTLANPTRGFGLSTNNVVQTATQKQEVQSVDEGSLEQLTIQEKPLTHDINRISFRRPQAKLTVGEPGDKYEQEANWMANRVMRMVVPDKLNPLATNGSDVYFGAGKAPGNNELTAYELTHLVQQTGMVQKMFIQAGSVRQDILQMMPPKIKTASLSMEEAQILLSKANKELAFELAQTAVDIAGIADPTPISDGISTAMSLAKGDYVGAGLSMISMIPYLGDAVGKPIKAARNSKKVLQLRKEIAELIQIIKKIDPEAIKKAEKTKEVVSQEIKTVFQKTVKKTENTIGKTDLKPWKQGAFHGNKPKYENPGHHDPSKNFRGGGSKTSILPNDAEEVYLTAIPSPDGKTWWGKNSQGEIYRYQSHADGKIHWNGRENSPRGLIVPNYIKNRFKNQPIK